MPTDRVMRQTTTDSKSLARLGLHWVPLGMWSQLTTLYKKAGISGPLLEPHRHPSRNVPRIPTSSSRSIAAG
jgi:hypothetical protein